MEPVKMIKKESLSKLLAGEINHEEKGDSFEFIYRGHSEIEMHYTKPMLPWIISEIRNQNKILKVKVTVKDGLFEVIDLNTGTSKIILSHSIKQIHKCVMEQADHRCFLYTLRPPEKSCGYNTITTDNESASTLIPSNLSTYHNYQCHLYQALNEHEVKSFFNCLRQQPREVKLQENDSLNSLADLSVHTESQFFEVLFIGRVKVSHCKVPETFIDEALIAFRKKQKTRKRDLPGENKQRSSSPNVSSYQSEGSGYSVPNLVLRGSSECESALPQNIDKDTDVSEMGRGDDASDHDDCKVTIEPLLQRMQHATIGNGSQMPELMSMYTEVSSDARARTTSIGSFFPRNKSTKPSAESDIKALGYDFNRTMLFHIGHREIQLINPELKSVQLHKPFKDVAGCSQGVNANDHFGFICRELSNDVMVFVGYIFRCDRSAVADEIMQALNRSFSAMHQAQQRDRKEHLMCDCCPLKWYSQLCAEVEGLDASKAHATIMKRVCTLPDEEKDLIIMKYEGAEIPGLVQKNNVLMLLLRTHFEYKQTNHSHSLMTNSQRSDFILGPNIESSLKKARKSITSFLKRDQRDSESAEKEIVPKQTEEMMNTMNAAADSERMPSPSRSTAVKGSSVLEGISDSPLRSYRQRSSTISGAGGDSIRKEFMANRNLKGQKEKENQPPITNNQSLGPKTNISLKFGSPSVASVEPVQEKESVRPATSFRHAILQTVVSPAKGVPVMLNRKSSTSLAPTNIKRPNQELMLLWKKSVFQQILLLRIERENQRRRAIQKEEALQKVKLNYEGEELPMETLQVWERLLAQPETKIDSALLDSGVKQGVPKLLRGEIWNLLTVQDKLFSPIIRQNLKDKRYPEHYNTSYEDILKELTSQHHAILIDLGRTFPCHPYFTQTLGPGQLSLFNILKAYSILDQEVGYCQGLSFVGGVLLMHVEEDLAYELLKHLMYDKGCRKQYRPDLDGLQLRMYQLSRLVHDKLRNLYDHLEKYEVIPQLYAAPWFLTIFASQFPLPFVGRVFDLLFLNGMEYVFCVCLVILETHEENLLSLDSFEQIMDYFKNKVPQISTADLSSFFIEVCECNLKKELSAYRVEYQVLQEELSLSPQQDANIQKLRESTKNLKRQNLDLLEQLHASNNRQQKLEASNQSLKQSQHHLEVRVRWLEMERNNMRNLIRLLCKNTQEKFFDGIPPNLERYLPHKASSPLSEERQHVPLMRIRRHSSREDASPPKDFSMQVPRQHSFSPIRAVQELPTDTSTPSDTIATEPPNERRPRASTLDPQSMQKYFKKIVHAE